MKTTTTAQNQNPKGGRDLGQITSEAYEYQGHWYAVVINPTGFRVLFPEEEADKARLIDIGHEFLNGYKELPVRAFTLAMTLADLTSKSKHNREWAKAKVNELVEVGRAVRAVGLAAIEAAKGASHVDA